MMNKEKKREVLKMMEPILAQSHFYLVNCQGLTANQSHILRGMLHEENIRCRVMPNTLLNILFKSTVKEELTKALKKTSMVLMTEANPSVPAKVLQRFHKETKLKTPELKGAFAYGEIFIGPDQLIPLTKLKSKEELIGEIIGLLQSPTQQVISALQSGQNQLAGVLETLASR